MFYRIGWYFAVGLRWERFFMKEAGAGAGVSASGSLSSTFGKM